MGDFYLWQDDPLLQNLYEAEMGTLKRGLSGDFKLLKILDPNTCDGRVVAIGELVYEKGKSQLMEIIFPTKYPSSIPKIIPLNLRVPPQQVKDFRNPPLLYGKGNQYGDGSMCLLRKDLWDCQQHNIGWLLRRSQNWLKSANSELGFRPDEIVEEYLGPVQHVGQVLLPYKLDLPENADRGEIVLSQFKANNYILDENMVATPPFRLKLNNETFRWFKFEKGHTFKSLFPTFSGQTLLDIFLRHFGENILSGTPVKNFALYIPDDANQWHFLKLITTQIGQGAQIQVQYYLVRTISEEMYLRTSSLFSEKILQEKRVTMIGLGALGSEIALSLARNGIGHFNLFDFDTFEVGNSVRHAADLFYVGERKVDAMKSIVLRTNPNITVNTYNIDILDDSGLLEESLKNSDLCIVMTGEESVDYLINDKYSTKYNIPVIFGRVSAGAMSGAIQVVDVESACLRCLSKSNYDTLPSPSTGNVYEELKPEYGSCSTPALPGSEVDTKEIALQATRIALQCLLKHENHQYAELTGKQFFWHGPYGSESLPPFHWEIKNYPKNENCPICIK